jgi:hypothetical protein
VLDETAKPITSAQEIAGNFWKLPHFYFLLTS